jgi:hypothetical protein
VNLLGKPDIAQPGVELQAFHDPEVCFIDDLLPGHIRLCSIDSETFAT